MAAAILSRFSLGAYAVTFFLDWRYEQVALVKEVHLVMSVPMPLLAAFVAVYAAHIIQSARREAFEAKLQVILTPEQWDQLQEMRQNRDGHRHGRGTARHGRKGTRDPARSPLISNVFGPSFPGSQSLSYRSRRPYD